MIGARRPRQRAPAEQPAMQKTPSTASARSVGDDETSVPPTCDEKPGSSTARNMLRAGEAEGEKRQVARRPPQRVVPGASHPGANDMRGYDRPAGRLARPLLPMRILMLSGIWPPDVGGPATHGPDFARFLAGRGHESTW